MANNSLFCKATPAEKRLLRRLPSLLIPGYVPPEPTAAEVAAEKAMREAIATRRRRLDYLLTEYRRRYPKLAAREDAMFEREEKAIRARVFGRGTTKGQ